MVCIYCFNETAVINSRPQKRSNAIWRRRRCTVCEAVFTTGEGVDLEKSMVVETAGEFKPFQRDKLFLSVYDSLKHRKTALSDATALSDTIIVHLLRKSQTGSVQAATITKIVWEILKRFDQVAYTHYGAYHPKSNK